MLVRPKTLLILCVVFFVCAIFDSTYLAYFPTKEAGDTPKEQDKPTSQPHKVDGPISSAVVRAIDAALDSAERHEKSLIVLSTIAIAIFTFTLWNATLGLFEMAQKQARDMRTSLRIALRAAKAAKESADAAKAANATERPWIFVLGAHIKRREDGDGPRIPNNYWIEFKCKNIGRAPAVIEEFVVRYMDESVAPDIPDYSNPIFMRCPRTVAVDTEFETNRFGPASQPDTPIENAAEYVFYGRITYRELNGTQHHTGFSIVVSPLMPATTSFPKDAYDYYD